MSGHFVRVLGCVLLCSILVACGGGGGGGGGGNSSSSAPLDTDRDGHADTQDAFPNDAAEWLDTDNDGVGDNGDAFPNDATETSDTDGDGAGDNSDKFPEDAAEKLDTDNDGVGDNGDAFPNDATETSDTDGDGVGNNTDAFPEDAAETLDTDNDGVGDNADAFPNDVTEILDSDEDGVGDNRDVFPTNPIESFDSDGDGVGNNSDKFPTNAAESADSDNDGLGDNGDAFPNDATETKDTDGDGAGDNSDLFPEDAAETRDSDSDGVGDNGDAFPNDANESKDTDGDGVGDNSDLFPEDAAETVDTDNDGLGDNGDLDPLGQPISAWATYQADAQHTGRVDITLATDNFQQRWSKDIALTSTGSGVAADGYIFLNNGGQVIALDARTGETRWTSPLGGYLFYSLNQPAYADGVVYVQTGGHQDAFLWAFSATDGSLLFKTQLEDQWSSFYPPTIVDGIVYIAGGYYGGFYAIDAKTGQELWWQPLNQYDQFTPAISGNYALAYTGSSSPKLTVADRITGNVEFEIPDPEFEWHGWSMYLAPVVAGDYVLANHYGRLVAFNLASRTLAWAQKSAFAGQPVVKGEHLYIINNGVIETRLIATGELVSSIIGSGSFSGDPLLTSNLLFVHDQQHTYAYQLDTGTLAWTLENTSGGMLMAEGALVIFTAAGVVSIDVEGDIDADGLPDWWEKRLHKNIDPAADTDSDGLTGLDEFNLNTHPAMADTDGDGLLDGEEAGGASSPLKMDSDGDGLSDFDEIKTHLTDATKVDSDSDSLSDSEEIDAGLNPLDGSDALADSDNDGYSNLHELRANTAITDANSFPQAGDWSRSEGNNQRNRYNPLLLDESRFSERWSMSFPQSLSVPVTSGDQLIMRASNNQHIAWDAGTGAESWRYTSLANSSGNLISAAGKLAYFTESNGSYGLDVVNASTGAHLSSKTFDNQGYSAQPLIAENTLYRVSSDSRIFEAYDLNTGDLKWRSTPGGNYYSYYSSHLLSDDHLIAVSDNALDLFATANGELVRTIAVDDGISEAMLGSQGRLIVRTQYGKLAAINSADGTRLWLNESCSSERLAVGNGQVYAVNDNQLCVLNEQTGALVWTMEIPYSWSSNNIVLTASHLFYSSGGSTYAINLRARAITWTMPFAVSNLVMGADGTLFLFNGSSVTAIDTDADGLPQWWERRYGADMDPALDLDADGLTNLEEYAAKTSPLVADTDGDGLLDGYEVKTSRTNPLLADTDKDGLSDGAEVNTHATDPLLADSDSDGLDDARELTLGLNPRDADDVSADSDGDGYNNLDEIYSGTDHTSAASVPQVSDWAMTQANAAHNGFQPYRLDEANFSQRWSKRFSESILPIATGDNHVFVRQGNYSNNRLISLNAVDGAQQWQQSLLQNNYVSAPLYSAGQVLVQTSNPANLQVFGAATGAAAGTFNLSSSYYANPLPSVFANNAYSQIDSNQIVATRLDTGANLWTANINGRGGEVTLNEQYLFYTGNAQIRALDRTTGAEAFSINMPTSVFSSLVLGSRNNILGFQEGLVSYDIATRQLNWSTGEYINSDYSPVVANGVVLYLTSQTLMARDEVNGNLRWSWRPDSDYLQSNIVATLSHIFVASSSMTYALSATTGEVLWTYNAGGERLALGADGALYIQSSQQLVAINLEGDSDGDDMPDWWERHYGLDPRDSNDAVLDLDADGLTNLEEFTNGTYADQVDSDGDQLSDADEVISHNTNPTNSDSDGDALRDDWELAYGLNPLDAGDRDLDSDGDSLPNYAEQEAGTDPTDALSLPAFFSAGVFSFEDAALPTGWVLSDTTTDVSISLNQASEGSKSLQVRNQADISFSGFFSASDLSIDVKAGCNYAGYLEVYVDEQLVSRASISADWTSLRTVISLGQHQVSIRTNSYSCEVYLDNVVIAPAQTNTQLGVQFVNLYDGSLQFIDANQTKVRSIQLDAMAQGVASIGNDKLVVAFGGTESRVGVLDLATFNWRYFGGFGDLANSYSDNGGLIAAQGNFAYVPVLNTASNSAGIARINLVSGAVTQFGEHSYSYSSLALDSAGSIYAYSEGVVYQYEPQSLQLVDQIYTVYAQQILIDNQDRLILINYNEALRYDAQRLIDQRISLNWPRSATVNARNELLVATDNEQIIWYSADWQRSQIHAIPANFLASFPQVDSDSDGMPDWWELANGLDINSDADAASDGDSDGLSALAEFMADTNPGLDDTDGDLVNDGDEVNDFNTDPHSQDSDSDGLTDAEEVLQHFTNPLLSDSDADSISDLLEVTQFMTDPNDADSKPAALVDFVESFELTVTDWNTPADTDAGWSVIDGVASVGSKSLRSGAIGDRQSSAVEWAAVFNQSVLSFDVRVSSESCCDHLIVYIDGAAQMQVQTNDQWQTQSLNMNPGFHKVRFEYRKDGSIAEGEDAVWIDNIRVQ